MSFHDAVVPAYLQMLNSLTGLLTKAEAHCAAKKIDPGVLVTDVTDETPASRGGLKTGDVIVNAFGQNVASLKQLQEAMIMHGTSGERSVPLVVVREKKQQKIVLNW